MCDDQTCTYDPLIELMARFENVRATSTDADAFAILSPEDRLKRHIIDGIKRNLERHLEDALQTYTPLQIINDILLDGMKTVGELFGAGKMQLPFVLQSAEVMKTSVAYLEPKMDKSEGSEKGSILLATVAGDVHDIGKNLVDIILSNNGYRVVNIGIKQHINSILDQAVKNECQVIGMSGLLVKSTLIMKENLVEMNERGLANFPVILGGAALTRAYVEHDLREVYDGIVYYAQDAFEGLRLMENLQADSGGAEPLPERTTKSHRLPDLDAGLFVFDGTKSEIEPLESVPALPFYGVRDVTKFSATELYKYINKIALYRGQWQFKRHEGMSNPEFDQWLTDNVDPIFEKWKRELAAVLQPRVQWGYFWCRSEGNDLIIYEEDKTTEKTRFRFPRQSDQRRLCLSDYFKSISSPEPDVVGFQIVTAGSGVSEFERKLFQTGDYQDYLFVHGMGVEFAEALAEYWHRQMRIELEIADQDPDQMKLLFSAKYRGARYSFGYPACPNLEDQAKLLEIMDPARIGIQLSEEFMLIPEQSTSAIVLHHPEAKYFNVK